MSSTQILTAVMPRPALLQRLVLPIYAVTIFTSALLLFALEPLFTKMALPALGGSPSVWSVAMVFFQTLMFAGYCYAYALIRWLPARGGVLLHGVVLALGFTSLPVALHVAGAPPTGGDPTWWLIAVFSASIGLPFFALSAQGPMLQAWFAATVRRKIRIFFMARRTSAHSSLCSLIRWRSSPCWGCRRRAASGRWVSCCWLR